jgi:hypothetical protein
MDTLLTALDEDTKPCPNLKLCQDVYKYEVSIKNVDASEKSESLKATILEQVFEDNMAPYYEQLCTKFEWTTDAEKLTAMRYLFLLINAVIFICCELCCELIAIHVSHVIEKPTTKIWMRSRNLDLMHSRMLATPR